MDLSRSYENLLVEQMILCRDQMEKLDRIVVTQCKLTGVNPLSQEMEALVNFANTDFAGKRPKNLLNPDAVNFMKSMFSIRGSIGKGEYKKICSQFKVTATQVGDFFAGQSSKVRNFIKSSANGSAASGLTRPSTDPDIPVEQVPLEIMQNTEEGPCCSDPSDRYFIENIFRLMRKEESFSEQVKLLKLIMQVKDPLVQNWFVTEGGVMILLTWLSEAAKKEQTSFLHLILDVLHLLPLDKAPSDNMSATLQSVKKLRNYKMTDISNRAKIQVSKWSNTFSESQPLHDKMLLKQNVNEVMAMESSDLKVNNHLEKELLLSCNNPDNNRKSESPKPLKMLTSPGDVSDQIRDVRERRKVQLLEFPSQSTDQQRHKVSKPTNVVQNSPLSADNIPKAKAHSRFIQSQNLKNITGSDDQVRPESQNRSTQAHDIDHPSGYKWRKLVSDSTCRTTQVSKTNDACPVAFEANSKELKLRNDRTHRERENIYKTNKEVMSNPSKHYNGKMDCDDTFTPPIPIKELPDFETLKTPSESVLKPDPVLLAGLLKNPELVFELTSGQSGRILSDDTMKVLDVIKENELMQNEIKHELSRNPFPHYQTMLSSSLPPQSSANGKIEARAKVPPVQPPRQWLMHNHRSNSSNNPNLAQEMTPNRNNPTNFNWAPLNTVRPATIRPGPLGNTNPSPGPQFPYLNEPGVANPLIARQGFEPMYHAHTGTHANASIRDEPRLPGFPGYGPGGTVQRHNQGRWYE